MSALGMDLSAMARAGDAAKVRQALERAALDEGDINFAFQAACEAGSVEAARELLEKTSIISVSRGMRKACASQSVECMRLAMARLEREDAFDQLDLGVALRDSVPASPLGERCALMAWDKAGDQAKAYALLEAIQAEHWETASWLARQGVSMEAAAFESQGARRPLGPATPGQAWERKKSAWRDEKENSTRPKGISSQFELRRDQGMREFESALVQASLLRESQAAAPSLQKKRAPL